MRANRNAIDKRRDQAEVGIGTMIVFIATVLVAAIAAAVLIDTSGKLQERSTRTGQQTTEQVASNLQVDSIIGLRDAASDAGIKDTEVYVALAPGASSVDLNELRIIVRTGAAQSVLRYVNGAASATEFSAAKVRDADGGWTAANPVMNAGDLVKLQIDNTAISQEWTPRTSVVLEFSPEVGNQIVVGFQTPNSYGGDTIIRLK
ncbi:MAG TPA: archaellin/type IV pilin N-terminal domain-containing protein [Candidatus Thermoplasmatota archaeon]|nr:archaellin/type IV pilin N-terminal domain-containing protein [Candidatus Thermoplasmatota archaeon]